MGSIGRWITKRRMKDPVKGTAFVVSANQWTRTQVPSPLHVKLVVEGDGIPKTTVACRYRFSMTVSPSSAPANGARQPRRWILRPRTATTSSEVNSRK